MSGENKGDDQKTRGELFREKTKPWLEWHVDALKVLITLFVFSGAGFVFFYLQSVGAPFSVADLPALTSLFLSVSLLFGFVAVNVAAFVLVPSISCAVPEKAHLRLETSRQGSSGFFFRLLRKTVLLDMPFYCSLMGVLAALIWSPAIFWQFLFVAIGILIGLSLNYYVAGKICSDHDLDHAATKHKWSRSVRAASLGYSTANVFVGLIWALLLLFSLYRITPGWLIQLDGQQPIFGWIPIFLAPRY